MPSKPDNPSWKLLIAQHYKTLILAFYLCWYLYIALRYFDPNYQIWSNAFFIALVVGIALNLNADSSKRRIWVTLRFFLIPFAVSSYTSLISGKGFFVIFPPSFSETGIGLLICTAFVFLYSVFLNKKHPNHNT